MFAGIIAKEMWDDVFYSNEDLSYANLLALEFHQSKGFLLDADHFKKGKANKVARECYLHGPEDVKKFPFASGFTTHNK